MEQRPVRGDAEVRALRAEGGANWRLALSVPGWPGFEPGQFAMLSPGARTAAERTDPLLPRPMAVYRELRRNGASAEVEILFKVSGRGTQLLAEVVPGQRVGWVGPLGRAFPLPEPGQRALLVGGGTGVASLYELAARAAAAGSSAAVLLGAATASDLMGGDDFARLDAELRVATEDGSAGTRGLVTDLLEPALDEPGSVRVYACGPTPMMERVAALAAARGVACWVSLENTMACGFGVCLGCAAPMRAGGYALVCSRGPVFEAGAVAWAELP